MFNSIFSGITEASRSLGSFQGKAILALKTYPACLCSLS